MLGASGILAMRACPLFRISQLWKARPGMINNPAAQQALQRVELLYSGVPAAEAYNLGAELLTHRVASGQVATVGSSGDKIDKARAQSLPKPFIREDSPPTLGAAHKTTASRPLTIVRLRRPGLYLFTGTSAHSASIFIRLWVESAHD